MSKKNMETYTVKEVGKSTKADGEIIQMHVHRTEKKDAGLIRNIVYFSKEQEIINNALILQYYFNKFVPSDTSELLFDVEAHGNPTSKIVPFYPIKKSVLNAIRSELDQPGERPISRVYADLHSRDGDFGDQARPKHQLSMIGARNGDGHAKTGGSRTNPCLQRRIAR